MDHSKPRRIWMLYCGIALGVAGVILMLFGPALWGPQVAVILIAVAALLIGGREWRNDL